MRESEFPNSHVRGASLKGSPMALREVPWRSRCRAREWRRQCAPPDLSSDRFSGALDGSVCLGRLGRRAVRVH